MRIVHTFKGPFGTTFHFSTDLSEEVVIEASYGDHVGIPGQDLVQFCSELLREYAIAQRGYNPLLRQSFPYKPFPWDEAKGEEEPPGALEGGTGPGG